MVKSSILDVWHGFNTPLQRVWPKTTPKQAKQAKITYHSDLLDLPCPLQRFFNIFWICAVFSMSLPYALYVQYVFYNLKQRDQINSVKIKIILFYFLILAINVTC